MAQFDNTYYLSSVGYAAVATRLPNQPVPVGMIVRQTGLPVVGNERCYICIIAGTTNSVTDPPWTFGRGDLVVDGTATWQECTGQSAVNGDVVNTWTWNQCVATATYYNILGQIIKRNNGASYHINKTGSFGAISATEPAFSDVAGTTVTDSNGVIWTSLGPVGNYTNSRTPYALFRTAMTLSFNFNYPGGTLYVADNHSEMSTVEAGWGGYNGGATNVLYSVGRILSYDNASSTPPATTKAGATIATSSTFTINPTHGIWHLDGIIIKTGVGATGAAGISINVAKSTVFLKNCSLQLFSTGASTIYLGGAMIEPGATVLENTTVRFNNVTDFINGYQCELTWKNTQPVLAAGSVIPTEFFRFIYTALIVVEACDLSQLTGIIFSGASGPVGRTLIKDCKLNAAAAIAGIMDASLNTVQTVRCDSGSAGYKSDRYNAQGSEVTEIAITRVGALPDPTGQVQSRRIIATGLNANWVRPFMAEPYATWNSIVGQPVIATVYGLVKAAAVPQTDDVWLEVEFLKSGILGGFVSTTKANILATGVPVASDGSTWNNASDVGPAPMALDLGFSQGFALSNNNRTALRISPATTAILARTLQARSTGKYYHEFTIVNSRGSSDSAGIAHSTATATNLYNGTNCAVVFPNYGPGYIYSNGGSQALIGAFVVGDVIGMATDLDNRKIWIRKNALGWNGGAIGAQNPVGNVGGYPLAAGAFCPAFECGNNGSAAGDGFTLNCGQATYANAAPAGFTNWLDDGTFWKPFKLVAPINAPPPDTAGYIHARVRVAKPATVYYIDPQISLSLA